MTARTTAVYGAANEIVGIEDCCGGVGAATGDGRACGVGCEAAGLGVGAATGFEALGAAIPHRTSKASNSALCSGPNMCRIRLQTSLSSAVVSETKLVSPPCPPSCGRLQMIAWITGDRLWRWNRCNSGAGGVAEGGAERGAGVPEGPAAGALGPRPAATTGAALIVVFYARCGVFGALIGDSRRDVTRADEMTRRQLGVQNARPFIVAVSSASFSLMVAGN